MLNLSSNKAKHKKSIVNLQTMKTQKLKNISPFNYELYGIVSPENDYKFVWTLINVLKMDFNRFDDIECPRISENVSFSIFGNQDNCDNSYIMILANKNENNYFIEELKNIDYLLMLQKDALLDVTDITAKIRKIENVVGVYKIDVNTLKNKDRLFF